MGGTVSLVFSVVLCLPFQVDCALFGQLCQIIYPDFPFPHKEILGTECANIKPYVERIRVRLWPDWYTLANQELIET